MWSFKQRLIKRSFDIVLAVLISPVCFFLVLAICLILVIGYGKNPFFYQVRIGKNAKIFRLLKLRTLYFDKEIKSFPPYTNNRFRRFLRRAKLDELPQVFQVLIGQMSFVGPRPDLPGYMDKVSGKYMDLQKLKPGITGPATLKYRNEDVLLAEQKNPVKFNDEVIWPDKLTINYTYFRSYSFGSDLKLLIKSVIK